MCGMLMVCAVFGGYTVVVVTIVYGLWDVCMWLAVDHTLSRRVDIEHQRTRLIK